MAVGTDIVNRIMEALGEISPGNGFAMDVQGRVRRGRPENLTINREDMPLIAVSTQENASEGMHPNAVSKRREITVDGVVAAMERDYEPDLDAMDEDIARALAPLSQRGIGHGATKVAVAGGQYTHPEGGSNLAAVTYTITVNYIVNWR